MTELEKQMESAHELSGDIELEETTTIKIAGAGAGAEAEVNSVDGDLSEFLADAFRWLEPFLYYSPTWIPKKSNNKTMKIYFGLLSVSVGIVLLWFALQFFFQITRWYLYSNIDNIIWCCYIVFITSARLLSIIYCHKYFSWPWKYEFESYQFEFENHVQSLPAYKKWITGCKRLAISVAICYVVIDFIVVWLETTALLPYYHDSLLNYIAMKFMCRVFFLYPQFIATIIQSVVLLKYCLCLHELYENMNISMANVDLQDIYEHYAKLYKLFKKDYHWTLAYSVQFYLAAEILFFWDSLNFIGAFVMFFIAVRELPVFVLYFYAASILDAVHRQFAKALWENAHFCLANKEKACYYNYILHYIQKYPIYLRFGSVIVSRKNVLKFSIGLPAARAISFGLRHWTGKLLNFVLFCVVFPCYILICVFFV